MIFKEDIDYILILVFHTFAYLLKVQGKYCSTQFDSTEANKSLCSCFP